MKTLDEIIEEVKDGFKPDYEDLRYALLAVCALYHFDSNAIRKLYQREQEGKYRPELFGLEWEAKESHRRLQTAFRLPPKQYVGKSHDPDTEECQKWRRISKGILKKITEGEK